MRLALTSLRACALALPLALAALTPALAHAVLVSSTPAANGAATPGKTEIRLRYNSRIDRGRSSFTLVTPDNQDVRLTAEDGGKPETVVLPAEFAAPGAYTLRWQVLAPDGHITRGALPFTVKAP